MNEDDFKRAVFISEDLNITRIHETLDVFGFAVFLIRIVDVFTFVQQSCGPKQNTSFDVRSKIF